jgi:hypothetical protein
MKFKIDNRSLSHFITHFVIKGVTKLSKANGKDIDKIWPDMFGLKSKKDWDLQITLNGVELPALEIFAEIESQMDELIVQKACSLIKDRFSNISEIMEDFEGLIINEVKEAFPEYERLDCE